MMLHFLVEGPAEDRLLQALLPRLIPKHAFKIYPHRGKGRLEAQQKRDQDRIGTGLLDQLPATLKVFGKNLRSDADRVVVLVDLDDDKEPELRQRLEELLKKTRPAPSCEFCLAIEESESWYLADLGAVQRAFAGQPLDEAVLKNYKPDSIVGAWELFQRLIKDTCERKPAWAERMGKELSVVPEGTESSSPSYREFCAKVRSQAGDSSFMPAAGPRKQAAKKRPVSPGLSAPATKTRR